MSTLPIVTPAEWEGYLLETLYRVHALFSLKRWTKTEYIEVCGLVRDAVVRAENKEFGCPYGRHSRRCSCGQ